MTLVLSEIMIHSSILVLSSGLIHSVFLVLFPEVLHSEGLILSSRMIHSHTLVLSVQLIHSCCMIRSSKNDSFRESGTFSDCDSFLVHETIDWFDSFSRIDILFSDILIYSLTF